MIFHPGFFNPNVKSTHLYSAPETKGISTSLQELYERIAQAVSKALSSLGDWLKGGDRPTGYMSLQDLTELSGGDALDVAGVTRLMSLPEDLRSEVFQSARGRRKAVVHCLTLALGGNNDEAYLEIKDIGKVDSLAEKIAKRDQRVDSASVGKFFRQLPAEVISVLSSSSEGRSELIAHCLAHLAQKKSPA